MNVYFNVLFQTVFGGMIFKSWRTLLPTGSLMYVFSFFVTIVFVSFFYLVNFELFRLGVFMDFPYLVPATETASCACPLSKQKVICIFLSFICWQQLFVLTTNAYFFLLSFLFCWHFASKNKAPKPLPR